MKLSFKIVRWIRFEYWPSWVFYFPLLPVWLVLSLRNRSLSFFTSVNPGIPLGGFFGESKQAILEKIPLVFLPQQVVLIIGSAENYLNLLDEIPMNFPFIIKPDIGERGTAVAKISSVDEWLHYCSFYPKGKYIVQAFIDFPEEFGILYSRSPRESVGRITSITQKKLLSVIGDGNKTVVELLSTYVRGATQRARLLREQPEFMQFIPNSGVEILVEPIGNHCRGTEFLDANHFLTDELLVQIDEMSKQIDGFYFGRFDIKVPSISDLKSGKNIVVMELNGVSSEPGHIYDKRHNYFYAYRVVTQHWARLAEIARANSKLNTADKTRFSHILKVYFQHSFRKKVTMK